jgi:hypothetical protein
MKGGEGKGAHRATFLFCLFTGIIGGNSEVFLGGGKFPLTGLDKTLRTTSSLCPSNPADPKALEMHLEFQVLLMTFPRWNYFQLHGQNFYFRFGSLSHRVVIRLIELSDPENQRT